jgi:hypothetical protein
MLISGWDKVGVTCWVGVAWLDPPLQATRRIVRMAITRQRDFFIEFKLIAVASSSVGAKTMPILP